MTQRSRPTGWWPDGPEPDDRRRALVELTDEGMCSLQADR
jgi:hypothetical protein